MFIPLWNGISRLNRWAAGSFVFCEATVFRALGGFSQELYAAEELEFSGRLKKLALERKKKVIILHRLGVIARKAGTMAIGSMITNSELAASRMYS